MKPSMKTTDVNERNRLYVTSDDKVYTDPATANENAQLLKDKTVRTICAYEGEQMVNRLMMNTDDDEQDEGYVTEEGW